MSYEHIKKISEAAFSHSPKEQQLQTVSSYFAEGKDTILVAPTGFGKSFIYQVAPFLYDSKYTLPSVNRTRRTNTIREQTFGSNVTTDVSSLSGFTSLSESRENGLVRVSYVKLFSLLQVDLLALLLIPLIPLKMMLSPLTQVRQPDQREEISLVTMWTTFQVCWQRPRYPPPPHLLL